MDPTTIPERPSSWKSWRMPASRSRCWAWTDLRRLDRRLIGPAAQAWLPDPALAAEVRGIRDAAELERWRQTIAREFGHATQLRVRPWSATAWRDIDDQSAEFPLTLRAEPSEASRERSVARLREVFETLRGPDGCPWDRAQTHTSLRKYVLEEAAEVVDAIDDGEPSDLAGELGDLLANIVLHAEIARQGETFAWPDVVQGITAKMVRRHPHVFGEQTARPRFPRSPPSGKTPNAPKPVETARRSVTERCPPWRRRPSLPQAWMAARHRTVYRRAPRLRFAGIEIRKSPATMPAPATRCWVWRSPPSAWGSTPSWRSATRCGGLARGSRPPSRRMPTVCRPAIVMSNRPRRMRLSGSPRPARAIPATIGGMYSAAFGA